MEKVAEVKSSRKEIPTGENEIKEDNHQSSCEACGRCKRKSCICDELGPPRNYAEARGWSWLQSAFGVVFQVDAGTRTATIVERSPKGLLPLLASLMAQHAASQSEVVVSQADQPLIVVPVYLPRYDFFWTLVGLCVVTIWICGFCTGRRFAHCGSPRAFVPPALPGVTDHSVQGPVTYLRRRATPRFQPLPEFDWGAWSE